MTESIREWRRRKDIFTTDDSINEWVAKVFVKQPLALPGSAQYYIYLFNPITKKTMINKQVVNQIFQGYN